MTSALMLLLYRRWSGQILPQAIRGGPLALRESRKSALQFSHAQQQADLLTSKGRRPKRAEMLAERQSLFAFHLPVAGLSLWLRASGPYSRATRKAAAMTGYSVVVGERRGSARRRPPRLAIPSRPRLEWTPPAFKTPCAIRETSSASWRPARPATSRSGTSDRTSR